MNKKKSTRTPRIALLRQPQWLAVAAAVAAILCERETYANSGIVLETVSDYTFVSGGLTVNNTDANTEGAGFWNPMIASGTWSASAWYPDSSVYDTDFYDPDLTGGPNDEDTFNFDRAGAAISFVIAHGGCDDVTNQPCVTDADCGANSYCPNFPLAGNTAACINISPRRIITSSPSSSHGNNVLYGDSPTNPQPLSIALGEDANSGSWAGVGTTGGTNIAIITNSCGMRFRVRSQDQNRFFAGVHEVMMSMPVGNVHGFATNGFADTAQWSARGSTLANLILTNINLPATSAWLTPNMTNNSFTAINGATSAGANIVAVWDVSGTAVNNRLSSETWLQSTDETRDATSGAVGGYWYMCNFSSCSSYTL